MAALERRWGAKRSEPFRIPWLQVRDIGINVEVDVSAEETLALAWEKWLREKVIERIPGGG